MNTERVQALQTVRSALNAVLDQINEIDDPKAPSLKTLFATKILLRELEDDLMASDLDNSADQLVESAQGLGKLVDEMNKADAKLSSVAQYVDKAAQVVKILGQIIELSAKIAATAI